jgi:hypothetical protein
VALVLAIFQRQSFRQQTIINVPAGGLIPRGQRFALHESQVLPLPSKSTFETTNFYILRHLPDH